MPFIQPPFFHQRDIQAVQLLSGVVERLYGTSQHRGIGHVELVAVLLEDLSGLDGFLDACGRESDVGPASEAVGLVPDTLSVAKKDDLVLLE